MEIRYALDISKLPAGMFIPIKRCRNVVMASVLPRSESSDGTAANIKIKSILGDQTTITRKELLSKYFYISGRPIKLTGWRSSDQHLVFSPDSSTCFGMQVPLNMSVIVKGKKANAREGLTSGDYIVCYGGADGNIDLRTATLISARLFHKMFYILEHPTITRNKGKNHKTFLPDHRLASKIKTKQSSTNGAVGMTGKASVVRPVAPSVLGVTPIHPHQTPTSIPTNSPTLPIALNKNIARPMGTPPTLVFKTISRIMDGAAIVGFDIQRDDGRVKAITADQMKALIHQGQITDIMVSKTAQGVEYFRGNGIKIEELSSRQL